MEETVAFAEFGPPEVVHDLIVAHKVEQDGLQFGDPISALNTRLVIYLRNTSAYHRTYTLGLAPITERAQKTA
jgi:hypothetical protein